MLNIDPNNIKNKNFLGFNRSYRVTEDILEEGEIIAAKGLGGWQPNDDLNLPN